VSSRAGLGGCRKSRPTGIRSRTVQPVGSRYTDCAIPAHVFMAYRRTNSPFPVLSPSPLPSTEHLSFRQSLHPPPPQGRQRPIITHYRQVIDERKLSYVVTNGTTGSATTYIYCSLLRSMRPYRKIGKLLIKQRIVWQGHWLQLFPYTVHLLWFFTAGGMCNAGGTRWVT
jgi:hypothetical protein